MSESKEPWYRDGLRFKCTQCGDCCTGQPGFVWIDEAETQSLACHFEVTPEQFNAIYTRLAHRGRSLREKPNGDCIFYNQQQGCTVYSIRPKQCRTWPVWDSLIKTPATWKKTCEICPGAGSGELIPVEDISRRLQEIRI